MSVKHDRISELFFSDEMREKKERESATHIKGVGGIKEWENCIKDNGSGCTFSQSGFQDS